MMKRLFLFLALLVPSLAFAQNSQYQTILLGPSGRPLAGAVVTVCSSSGIGIPCSPTVNIFNSTGAGISNPTFSDGLGNLQFWAPPGTYIYTVTGNGITPYTQSAVLPCIVGASCANAGIIPNTSLAFSATPSFAATTSASYSMTLTANVTSSTITGIPINGNLLSLTLVEDATGGRTFAFPGNFVFPVGYAFDTTALHTNALTFKFDGTNWNLISNSGGGSSLSVPGNVGDLPAKLTGTTLAASGENDDGTVFTINRDAKNCGPNPWVDVRCYGAKFNGSTSTFVSSWTDSTHPILSAAQTFVNTEGITINGAGLTNALSTPSAPTVLAADPTYLPGTGHVIANPGGGASAAYSIAAVSVDGQISAASATTSIANQQTLGQQNVQVSSWSRSNNLLTITTSGAHTLVVNDYVMFTGDADLEGGWNVTSSADNTHFVLTQNQDTRQGANTIINPANTPYAYYWHCNHITWSPVANAFLYLVYRGATLIGVSYPENAAVNNTSLYDSFDDFGSTLTVAPNVPTWWPTSPGAAKNGNLTTTITAGGGTAAITIANAATNQPTGAAVVVTHDDTPGFRAAALFAQAHKYCIYAPSGDFATQAFAINSTLTVGDTGPFCMMQGGSISLNSPIFVNTNAGFTWQGTKTPQLGQTIGFQNLTQVFVGTATPGLYVKTTLGFNAISDLNFNISSPAAGMGIVFDGGSIPSLWMRNVGMASSGATNYMAKHFVARSNNGSGGTGFFFDFDNFSGGPGQGACPGSCSLVIPSPLVAFEFLNSQRITFNQTNILNQGISITAPSLNLAVTNVDANGPNMAIFNLNVSLTLQASFCNTVDDTSNRPLVNFFGGGTGYISTCAVQGQTPGFPSVVGPPGIALVNQGQPSTSLSLGQNIGANRGLIIGPGVDGIRATNAATGKVEVTFNESHTAVGPSYTIFVRSAPQIGVTCAASGSGGTIAAGNYYINVAPVFATNNSEGTFSYTCFTTVAGAQTIPVAWPQVTGAIGYNVYIGLVSNGSQSELGGCVSPGFSGLTFTATWTGAALCGGNGSAIPGGGPTSIAKDAITSPSFILPGGNGGGVYTQSAPTLTANRTESKPNASGTTVTSTVAETAALTGQVPVASNGGAVVISSPGIADGNAGAAVTTTPYTVLCDSATALRDRSTTIRFQAGASVINLPDHTASGCGSNMAFILINENAGKLTVNRGGSDTLSVYGQSSVAQTAKTSFNFYSNQTVALNNGAGTVWEARFATPCPQFSGNTFYPACYGAAFNGNVYFDATTTATTGVVTSPTAHFQSRAIVNEDAYVLNGSGVSISGTGVCKIQSIDSDTQVTFNCNNNTVLTGTGALFFGTNDDVAWTDVDTAVSSAGLCQITVKIPAGISRVTQAHLTNATYNLSSCPSGSLDGTLGGVTLLGDGIKSSIIAIGPGYAYGAAGGVPWGNGQKMYFQYIQFHGFGIQDPASDGKTFATIGGAGDTQNFAISQMNSTRTMAPISFSSNGAGCKNSFFDTVGVIGATSQTVINGCFITRFAPSSGFVSSQLSSYGQTVGPGVNIAGATTFTGVQDKYYAPSSGVLFNFEITGTGANVFLNNVDLTDNTAATTGLGLQSAASINITASKLSGGNNGAIYSTGASGTPVVDDEGGNTFTCTGTCTNPLQNFTTGTWTGPGENNVYGSCTGAVTANTTLGFYNTGPNVTLTTCTSTNVGTGNPMKGGGRIYGVIVSNVSGTSTGDVVTVLKNGATATGFTCTVTTSAGCRQLGVAPVAVVQGDLISAKVVTAVGSTMTGYSVAIIVGL